MSAPRARRSPGIWIGSRATIVGMVVEVIGASVLILLGYALAVVAARLW